MSAPLLTGNLFGEPVGERATEGGRYRWELRRRWSDGGTVCWVMLNPSTADATRDDPTLRRCIHFSRSWGYGALVVVNLYPFRSSSPAACRAWSLAWHRREESDRAVRDAMRENVELVAATAKAAAIVVAAWGAAPWSWQWAEHVAAAITGGAGPRVSLHCIGVTADGSPKHPLARGSHRVPDDQRPVRWPAAPSAGAREES